MGDGEGEGSGSGSAAAGDPEGEGSGSAAAGDPEGEDNAAAGEAEGGGGEEAPGGAIDGSQGFGAQNVAPYAGTDASVSGSSPFTGGPILGPYTADGQTDPSSDNWYDASSTSPGDGPTAHLTVSTVLDRRHGQWNETAWRDTARP